MALGEVEHDVAEGRAQRPVEQRPFGEAADPQIDVPEALVGAGECPLAGVRVIGRRPLHELDGRGVVCRGVPERS